MNKITKAGVGVAAIATVAAGALVISAWGPDRPTYTMNDPADHVTFNSITDNSMLMGGYTMNGDERYFVEASPFTGDASTLNWDDETTVENGKEYVVHMYVHNDAASNLNLEAENVRAHVLLPTDAASSVELTGMISSSNATPNNVYDVTNFVSADGRDFFKIDRIHVELYTDRKDPVLENSVETVLDRHGIFYNKSEVWIDSEKLYEVLYQFELEGINDAEEKE